MTRRHLATLGVALLARVLDGGPVGLALTLCCVGALVWVEGEGR